MSTRYAVLLRGVNVGGVTVRSADLRAALEAAGFADVRTVLASGNALVSDNGADRDEDNNGSDGGDGGRVSGGSDDSDGPGSGSAPDGARVSDVRSRAEAALLARFDREIRVVVRSQVTLESIARACPYPADSETHHAYVVLLGDPAETGPAFATAAAAEASSSGSANAPAAAAVDEAVAAGDGALYWWCPRGSSLTTPVSKAVDKLSRTTLTTTRNLRTLARLTSG